MRDLIILKRILKTLESIDTTLRRLLILAEVDADVPMEDLGGPGGELAEALGRLDETVPSIIHGDEDRGSEERRRVI